MMLVQPLHYLFRGKASFRRIFILTLLQLLPIVGQLILLGYGFDIVRALYAGLTELPPIRWQAALGNGLRFVLAGFAYLLPILIAVVTIVLTMAGTNKSAATSGFGSLGGISVLVTIGLILLVSLLGVVFRKRATSPAVQQPAPKKPGGGLRLLLQGLLPIVVTILVTFALSTLVSLSGLTTGKPNGLGILLLVILALFIFLLWIVLYIGGVRQALENKGLLAPIVNLKLLLKDRALTGGLLLKLILLGGITVVTTAIGLVLFVLPGLAAFVLGSLALWYLFAQYSISDRLGSGSHPHHNFPEGFARHSGEGR